VEGAEPAWWRMGLALRGGSEQVDSFDNAEQRHWVVHESHSHIPYEGGTMTQRKHLVAQLHVGIIASLHLAVRIASART
jgi:hypothetical protein